MLNWLIIIIIISSVSNVVVVVVILNRPFNTGMRLLFEIWDINWIDSEYNAKSSEYKNEWMNEQKAYSEV